MSEWTYCIKNVKGSYPPPGKKVVIAVKTRYKDEFGNPFIWRPYAIRTDPDYMTILGTIGEPRIRLERVLAWKKERKPSK